MNNKLLIEVSSSDHAYVESVCLDGSYTFASLFSHMLNLYRKSLVEPMKSIEQEESESALLNSKVKKKKI